MQKKHGTPPLLSAFCFITVFGGAPGRTRTVRPEKTSVLGLNNVDFGDTINIGYNVTLQSSPFKKFFGRAMFSCRKHSAAEGAAVTTKEFAKLCGVEKRTLFFYDEIDLLKPARHAPAVRERPRDRRHRRGTQLLQRGLRRRAGRCREGRPGRKGRSVGRIPCLSVG